MNILYHSFTSFCLYPFFGFDASIGAIFPDLFWIPGELNFRFSSINSFSVWSCSLERSCSIIRLYHLGHNVLMPVLLSYLLYRTVNLGFLVGYIIHLLLDCKTHKNPFILRWFYWI